MKTFVKATMDYRDVLVKGKLYEVEHEFDSNKTTSNHVIVIDTEHDLICLDAKTFFDHGIRYFER